jgi:hypothetical protein
MRSSPSSTPCLQTPNRYHPEAFNCRVHKAAELSDSLSNHVELAGFNNPLHLLQLQQVCVLRHRRWQPAGVIRQCLWPLPSGRRGGGVVHAPRRRHAELLHELLASGRRHRHVLAAQLAGAQIGANVNEVLTQPPAQYIQRQGGRGTCVV